MSRRIGLIDTPKELSPSTARKIFVWQMAFFAAVLTLSAIDNAYTVRADHAHAGDPIELWRPMVWESSSHLLTWLLIPAVSWLLIRFPITRQHWWRSLPTHVLATLPFSLIHTGGMVLMRQLVYRAVGARYDFGPFWDNWPYEYRKDFFTYLVILGSLAAFRVYGLWRDSHAAAGVVQATPPAGSMRAAAMPLDRLLVRKRNREFILDPADIDRIDADGNYVVVHAAGETYRLRDSLEGLLVRLGEQKFARVHRAHVVNIDRIREIQPWDHGDYRILLEDGSFLNFSRRYRSRLSHLFRQGS
ncbi:MAG TPA: LytTR family DNA-binding domain-containing protein [Steroidobacteraceae bacterium]|jgi:hypothetical protein|nr:LytTR family DNA-binding domain-containing protein [Steroidobacteraceae bacterium]